MPQYKLHGFYNSELWEAGEDEAVTLYSLLALYADTYSENSLYPLKVMVIFKINSEFSLDLVHSGNPIKFIFCLRLFLV